VPHSQGAPPSSSLPPLPASLLNNMLTARFHTFCALANLGHCFTMAATEARLLTLRMSNTEHLWRLSASCRPTCPALARLSLLKNLHTHTR